MIVPKRTPPANAVPEIFRKYWTFTCQSMLIWKEGTQAVLGTARVAADVPDLLFIEAAMPLLQIIGGSGLDLPYLALFYPYIFKVISPKPIATKAITNMWQIKT
jgi:hypothetical protein